MQFGEKYKGNAATGKQTSNGINLKKPKMLRGVIINIWKQRMSECH